MIASYPPRRSFDIHEKTEALPDFSKPPGDDFDLRMAQIFHYYVKNDRVQDWTDAIGKINKALVKHDWPAHPGWSTLVNGGTGLVYTLARFHESWASMASPDTPFPVVLEETFGRHDSNELLQTISESVIRVDSWMARLRPDLSYIPAAGS